MQGGGNQGDRETRGGRLANKVYTVVLREYNAFIIVGLIVIAKQKKVFPLLSVHVYPCLTLPVLVSPCLFLCVLCPLCLSLPLCQCMQLKFNLFVLLCICSCFIKNFFIQSKQLHLVSSKMCFFCVYECNK